MRISFAEFDLDTTTFELRQGGRPVPMEPQVFEVLVYLVRHRDRVVSKEELLDEIWGDRFVSESTLTSRIKNVRRALRDDGRTQRWIKTVHGRGYRFVGDIGSIETASAAPGSSGGSAPNNLPANRTPLFGRADAVAQVTALVGRNRVVTLLGIGGTGKTRLAAAAGQRLLEGFPDGIWFVDLVPATDSRSLETAIAHAAGLALSTGETRTQLTRMLAHRQVLLILDNAEHVRDELALTLDHLLEQTSAPRFLVTSRVPLDLPDERQLMVPPLGFDDGDAPAVDLFFSSAERFGAAVAAGDRSTVRRICRDLDGLPLAIELAAAQLRVLRPDDIVGRLDQRFELLQARTSPGRVRHASLLSVLESTWALLDADEREFLGRLAAFPGTFTVVDVEQLSDDLPPGAAARTLAQLVAYSLVAPADPDEFRLLESVRLFALTQGDAARHRARHARWCLERVGRDVRTHLYDCAAADWCTVHYDDLRAAERQLIADGRTDDAALLIAAIALSMRYDTGARAADVLPRVEAHARRQDDPGLAARLHFTGVQAGMAVRAPDVIAEHGEDAVRAARAADDPALLAVALVLRSWSTALTDRAAALAMVEQAGALAENAGDTAARNLADSYRAFHLAMVRRYEEAIEQAEAVIARSPTRAAYGQDTVPAIAAVAACCAVNAPHRALRWVDHLLNRPPYAGVPMWGNQVVAAAAHAADGDPVEALSLVEAVRTRLSRAGQDSLPDILVPAAILAHRMGEDGRADRWLRAVRSAGRPTCFEVTCVYRRIREVVGTSADDPPAPLEEVGDEALTWMRAVSRG